MKRSRIRPISEKQRLAKRKAAALVAEQGEGFYAAIRGKRCVVCGRAGWEARRAGTRLQAHHAIGKQRLKRLGLEEWLWDPRNAVAVCEEPCHRRHTDAVRRIQLTALPPEVFEFADELGLRYALEREYEK